MVTYCLVTGLHTLSLYFASNLQTEKSRKNIQTDLRLEMDKFYQYYVSRTRACFKCLCLALYNTENHNETSFTTWGMNPSKNHLTVFTSWQHMKRVVTSHRLYLEHLLFLPQCFCIKQIFL